MALRIPSNAHTWTHSKGSLDIWLAAPDVVVQRARGHAVLEAVEVIARFIEPLFAPGKKLTLFDDWEDVTGYDTDGRLALTTWTERHRPHLDSIHILVRSKLLAMGIAVANLATGGINVTYASRDSFEKALAKKLRPAESQLTR